MDYQTAVILDNDDIRRSDIYRTLVPSGPVIPIATPQELGSAWPQSAWFFVFDDEQALAQLHAHFAKQRRFHPIVVYSDKLVASRIVAAIYNGAMNYMVWPATAERVREAIESVADLAHKRCAHAAARLMARDKLSALTRRENDVLEQVANGLTNKEIARDLAISPRTVEIHRANALSKIGARNTADAARIVIEATGDLASRVVA